MQIAGTAQAGLRLILAAEERARMRFRPLLRHAPQLSRYTVVSAAALALDTSIFLMLAAGGMQAVPAGAVGYACGLALHFVLSKRYVFDARSAGKTDARLFAEFALSGLAGLAMTAAVIALTVDARGMPLLPAKILAVGASFLAVFALRRGVVFAPRS